MSSAEVPSSQAQALLLDNSPPSQASGDNPEHASRAVPAPSRWSVFKFVMFTPMDCSRSMALLLLLLGVGSSVGLGILFAISAKFGGPLLESFKTKNIAEFNEAFSTIVIIMAAQTVMQGISTYSMKHIGLLKRIHLNRMLHSNYFACKKFYLLNAFHSDHCDSVDSRLTSDIDTMTSELYSILQVLAVSITNFTYGLSLLGNSTLAAIGLLCLILYSVIMLGIVQFFSKLTSSRVSGLKQDEGFFSFQHTRIKKNCESIAFYSGQSLELAKIKLRFDAVLQSARKVIKAQMILDFLGNFYQQGVGTNFVIWIGKRAPCAIARPFVSWAHLTPLPFRLCVLLVDQNLEYTRRSNECV